MTQETNELPRDIINHIDAEAGKQEEWFGFTQGAEFGYRLGIAEIESLRKENEAWKSRQESLEDTISEQMDLLDRMAEWIQDNASEEATANDEREKLLTEYQTKKA